MLCLCAAGIPADSGGGGGGGGPQMTEWERQREEDEFARAAKVFQPLSDSLSSRFTRGADEESAKRKEKQQPERPLVRDMTLLLCDI